MTGVADQTRTAALDRVLAAAAKMIPHEGGLAALEVGGGEGDLSELAARHGMSLTALRDVPVADGDANLVLSVDSLGGCEAAARPALVERMWRALAPGGWLVVVEELVPSEGSGLESGGLGTLDLEADIVEGTGGGAILEHFEALRYPAEDLRRTGLAICSKASGTRDAVRIHGLSLSTAPPSQQELGYGSRG